ncbi:MAG: 2-hydroxyacid dehydrogenase [Actinomycetales bacterium]
MADLPIVTLPERSLIEALSQGADGVELRYWDVAGEPDFAGVERIHLVVLPYLNPPQALARLAQMPAVRAVQTLTAGYDGLIEQLPDGVALCNAAGVHDASTAELAVGLMLAGQRGIGDAAREQVAGEWNHITRPSLADRRVLVVGVGGVGTAIAARLEPFEVTITRVGTRARADDLSGRFGDVHGIDELPALLPDHDIVALAVPLSASTRGLFGAELLAAMADDALLVSVARGPVVDTDALTAEVGSGRLRAAVDVIDPEPFPADHPLRLMPGFLMTPHVGGDTDAFVPRAERMLAAQVARVAAGEPLANIVHP